MIPEQMIQSVLFNESKNIQRSKTSAVWFFNKLVLFSEKQIPSADSQMNDSCDSGLFIEFINM